MFFRNVHSFGLNLLQYTVLERWAGGSLSRRPRDPFAVSRPRQLDE